MADGSPSSAVRSSALSVHPPPFFPANASPPAAAAGLPFEGLPVLAVAWMDDSGLLRGALVLLLMLLPVQVLLLSLPSFLPPPPHMVALRRTAGGGLPPLPPLPRRQVVLVLLLPLEDDAPAPQLPPALPPAASSPDRLLRIDARVAADKGRRGGVPLLLLPDGEIEDRDGKDPDDSLHLPLGRPSCDPRLPMLPLPQLPKLDVRPRPMVLLLIFPCVPTPLPLPPEPDPPLLVELHRGRLEAFLLIASSFCRSFRSLYSASRSSMVRASSSTALPVLEFSSTTGTAVEQEDEMPTGCSLPLVVAVAAGSSEGSDRDRDPAAAVEAVVGRKSASSSIMVPNNELDRCSISFATLDFFEKTVVLWGFPDPTSLPPI